jgi:hypothetical protein
MKKLMNILMLSCRKATELIEKKLYFKLNKIESVQLIIHTSMCNACKTYEKQSKAIDHVLQSTLSTPHVHSSVTASDDFKDTVKDKIQNI